MPHLFSMGKKSKGINVLSLFDGISCGQVALKRAKIKVNQYYSSEIDEHAIKITQKNFPKTKQLGDIKKLNKLPKNIDLLIGGSPCQGFSMAGKRLNFEDPRSKLFFDYVKILKKVKPRYFLLENVKMRADVRDQISELLGVQPIEINSKTVSGQNRVRYYWTNIPITGVLKDKNISLQSILEEGTVDKKKSYCIDASYFKGGNLKSYFEKHRRQLVFNGEISRKPKKGFKKIYEFLDEVIYFKKAKKNKLTYSQDIYRKLTPLECERLQTLPKNYTKVEGVSNTHRYKSIGNGWTVDVLKYLFKNIE